MTTDLFDPPDTPPPKRNGATAGASPLPEPPAHNDNDQPPEETEVELAPTRAPLPPAPPAETLGASQLAGMLGDPIVAPHANGKRVEFIDTGRLHSPLTLYNIASSPERRQRVFGCHELRWNEMSQRAEADGHSIDDVWIAKVREECEKLLRVFTDKGKAVPLVASKEDLWDAVLLVAHESGYHPVRDYLSALPPWDGVGRLAMLPAEILNAAPTPLAMSKLRCWFISAIARAMKPGCKVDTMLVLISGQGTTKSSLFAALAEPWFSDASISGDLGGRDTSQIAANCWIWEWAELSNFRGLRRLEELKAYVSRREDVYVGKWQRAPSVVPRSFVLGGSTNTKLSLPDDEENRRFWPIETGRLDVAKAAVWRPQLWAEALAAYRAGEQWWLKRDLEDELREHNKGFVAVDAWTDLVADYCDELEQVTIADVLHESAVNKQPGQWSRADEMRVATCLERAGWGRVQRRIDGRHRWVYTKR